MPPPPVKPTTYLNWVPDGNASYIAQPPSGQMTTGWVFREAPPFRYMNWLFYYTDQWIKWLDFLSGTATATPIVLSTTGDIVLGSNMIQNLASIIGITRGQTVLGTGIAPNSIVTKITGSTVFMTEAATATLTTSPVSFNHTFAQGTTAQQELDQLDAYAYILGAQATPIDPATQSPYQLSSLIFSEGDGQKVFLVDTSTGAMTFNMPPPVPNFNFTIKDLAGLSTANIITLVPNGGEKIDGIAGNYLAQIPYGVWYFFSDGTDWFVDLRQQQNTITKNAPTVDDLVVPTGYSQMIPNLTLPAGATYNVQAGASLISFNSIIVPTGASLIVAPGGQARVI